MAFGFDNRIGMRFKPGVNRVEPIGGLNGASVTGDGEGFRSGDLFPMLMLY
jgi:hypothetical protein